MRAEQAERFAQVILDCQEGFTVIELPDKDLTLIIGAFESLGCHVGRDGQKLTISRQKPD